MTAAQFRWLFPAHAFSGLAWALHSRRLIRIPGLISITVPRENALA